MQRRRPLVITVSTLAITALAACDNTGDSNAPNTITSTPHVSAGSTGQTSPTTTATSGSTGLGESTGPTGSAQSSTAATSTATTTHDDSSARRAKLSQIPPAKMAGLNAQWVWDASTAGAGVRPTGPASSRCMRSSMTAIGGVTEYSTRYTSTRSAQDEAMLTTAVFPDEHTAVTTASVLSTWLRTCRDYTAHQPGVEHVTLGADHTVATEVGDAHQRLVSFGPVNGKAHAAYFNGEGYVRDGDVISYLVMHSVGQDYNYPVGSAPVDHGLQVAATYLKRSR